MAGTARARSKPCSSESRPKRLAAIRPWTWWGTADASVLGFARSRECYRLVAHTITSYRWIQGRARRCSRCRQRPCRSAQRHHPVTSGSCGGHAQRLSGGSARRAHNAVHRRPGVVSPFHARARGAHHLPKDGVLEGTWPHGGGALRPHAFAPIQRRPATMEAISRSVGGRAWCLRQFRRQRQGAVGDWG